MKCVLPMVLLVCAACGDDDAPAEPVASAEPVVSVLRQERCLPAELEGAEVLEAPRLITEAGMDELQANYAVGEALVRVSVFLYGESQAARERELEAEMLEQCSSRPACEERRIGGHRARLIDLGVAGQESTIVLLEPGVRVSVLAPVGRSAAFAELLDLSCLQGLHGERQAD